MYIPTDRTLGDVPARQPWRVRAGVRPEPPQYLSFLTLDQFKWNQTSLTPPLKERVKYLARHVQLSWNSMRPIGFVRLVGHTDGTGPEKYNVDLGNRRAQAVKNELQDLLKEDILKRGKRIAISVEPSPGASAPKADNRTKAGRERNRRVEVFVAPPDPPAQKIDITGPVRTTKSVIETTPSPFTKPVPTLPPGGSFNQWLDQWLRDRRVPKWLSGRIRNAIVGKEFGALNSLLDAAGVGGPQKQAFLETVRALSETRVR